MSKTILNNFISSSQGMTGFARVRENVNLNKFWQAANINYQALNYPHELTFELEASSVNGRFLEITYKSDDKFRYLETQARRIFKEFFERGRINVNLIFYINDEQKITAEGENVNDENINYQLPTKKLALLLDLQKQILEQSIQAKPLSVNEIIKLLSIEFNKKVSPMLLDQISQIEGWQNYIENTIADIFIKLAQNLQSARIIEAKNIVPLMLEKCLAMQKILPEIIDIAKEEKSQTYEKVRKQINDLAVELDPQRLAQEAAILATRVDITEECERLSAHLENLENLLTTSSTTLGKSLEFLLQELGREVNTIASKTSTNEITNRALIIKTTLEKIREQSQNLQ